MIQCLVSRQDHSRPLLRIEPVEGVLNPLLNVVAARMPGRLLVAAPFRAQPGAPHVPLAPIEAAIDRDPPHPSSERRVPPEPHQLLMCLNEGFLRHIFGIGQRTRHPK